MAEKLEEQLEELLMMQRVDQELNATLNLESVMQLTIDWAMRRTGASVGMLSIVSSDGSGLIPFVALGYDPDRVLHNEDNPAPFSFGVVGRAARTRQLQYVRDVRQDSDYHATIDNMRCLIAAPIEMHGRLLGVLTLESEDLDGFGEAEVSFVKRLASRAAIALDNARLYKETERRADEMSALYAASRSVSSSIERADVLRNSVKAVGEVLGVSSVMIADLRADLHRLTISAVIQAIHPPHSPDKLPPLGTHFDLSDLPEFANVIKQHRIMAFVSGDKALSAGLRSFMEAHHLRSLMALPLAVQEHRLGLLLAADGRRERRFSRDDILMGESLAGQIAAALRQAKLYEDVRELESLKSEMIRMASHDLRNPLGNVMGYLELLMAEVGDTLDINQNDYVNQMRTALNQMKALIEDLLTLEKIESERQAAFGHLNLSSLLEDVFMAQQFQANRKNQTINLAKPFEMIYVQGSNTQLRQAFVNLINNAIKYTPENGMIHVRLMQDGARVRFEVQDNGFGISKEKQGKLYQRFYRAREPQTEHITGTGLGLSLVKTVVERHGGEVWVKSELGVGSTFGFWLPIDDSAEDEEE
jgi:signal transduction histidine kinase